MSTTQIYGKTNLDLQLGCRTTENRLIRTDLDYDPYSPSFCSTAGCSLCLLPKPLEIRVLGHDRDYDGRCRPSLGQSNL